MTNFLTIPVPIIPVIPWRIWSHFVPCDNNYMGSLKIANNLPKSSVLCFVAIRCHSILKLVYIVGSILYNFLREWIRLITVILLIVNSWSTLISSVAISIVRSYNGAAKWLWKGLWPVSYVWISKRYISIDRYL